MPYHSKINFWLVQLIGWGSFLLLNTLLQGGLGGKNPFAFVGSVVSAVNGLILTSYFRFYVKKKHWNRKSPVQLIIPVFVATAIIAVIWAVVTLLIIYIIAIYKGIRFPLTPVLFLGNYISGQLIMIIWSALYFAYQYFLKFNRAEIEKWQLEATAKEAQLGFLKAQINPHFLFNALNNIRALILEDPTKARNMLTHLSDFLRYPLYHSGAEMVTLETELDIVNNYLELVAIQYENQLSYTVQCATNIGDTPVPPMIIQLLVENAVKHGVANSTAQCELRVSITSTDGEIKIIVANTGHFMRSNSLEKKLGVGLKNIQERLNLLYDGQTKFDIVEDEGWVIAQIKLPLDPGGGGMAE